MCFDETCLNWWQMLLVLFVTIYLLTGIVATAVIVMKAGPRYDKIEEPLSKHLFSCLVLVFILPAAMLIALAMDRVAGIKNA